MHNYYTKQYRIDHDGSAEVTDKVLAREQKRARRVVNLIRQERERVNSVLDIGSSTGELLRQLQAVYWCKTFGVEPNKIYREYSAQFCDFVAEDQGKMIGGGFDLITCVHTLEHVTDPIHLLDKPYYSDDCLLFLEVPLNDYNTGHVVIYDRELLDLIVGAAGWEPYRWLMYGNCVDMFCKRRKAEQI